MAECDTSRLIIDNPPARVITILAGKAGCGVCVLYWYSGNVGKAFKGHHPAVAALSVPLSTLKTASLQVFRANRPAQASISLTARVFPPTIR